MENRYLAILHENISLSVLRVSNESRLTGRMGGGRAMRGVLVEKTHSIPS